MARDERLPALPAPARAIVLVEGTSDRCALETVARRRARDLNAEGIAVIPIGGAKNIRLFLERFASRGEARLAGLCDAGEEADFRRGLERAGFGPVLDRDDLEARGFYVCVADLEDELIRSLGADAVEAVIDAEGELGSFRILQKQPAQQERPREAQLRRFMGTRSGRKLRYARALAEALDLTRVPRPLDHLLAGL